MSDTRYKKVSIVLESYLKAKGYHNALLAFHEAKRIHSKKPDGTPALRDDGTPAFQHQIEICLFIMTLKEVEFEEDTFVAALLHDIREDYNMEHDYIKRKYGTVAADAVEKLTKEFKGHKKDTQEYFDTIALCPIASIVKLADRIHNVSSMVGTFTIKRQEKYVKEIKDYFFPLIKKCLQNFPKQHMSYYCMSTNLKTMCRTVEAVLLAEKELNNITLVGPKIPKM